LLKYDDRLFGNKENYGGNVFKDDNLLYKTNQEILNEMEMRKQRKITEKDSLDE
jgi:hypothetical protein